MYQTRKDIVASSWGWLYSCAVEMVMATFFSAAQTTTFETYPTPLPPSTFHSSSARSKLDQEIRYFGSIPIHNLVRCIYRNLNCAQVKRSLHLRWNFISTHMSTVTNADKRKWRQIQSYSRGVLTRFSRSQGSVRHDQHWPPELGAVRIGDPLDPEESQRHGPASGAHTRHDAALHEKNQPGLKRGQGKPRGAWTRAVYSDAGELGRGGDSPRSFRIFLNWTQVW